MNPSADPQLDAETYYQLRSPKLSFEGDDVDGRKRYVLSRGDYVLCAGFVRRRGEHGTGRYAKLLHQADDGQRITLFLRVTRNNRGSGQWLTLNPMLVVALSDKIPTL